MVHRPADSRLLTNLLSHEKDYAKHLLSLLDYSHASLASFSAYASASSPPASQVILSVASSLAGADDALRLYAASVDEWREMMKGLKTLEDEVGNIMRDREILVTRLIKASKSQKPARESKRDSLLLGQHQRYPSSSSLSLSQADSPSQSPGASGPAPSTYAGSGLNTSSKLAAAQSELQACETHLAAKEQELAARRNAAVKEGLGIRCRAMAECGWVWSEMGKEALKTLQILGESAVAEGHGLPVRDHLATSAPLPATYLNSPQTPITSKTLASRLLENTNGKPLPEPATSDVSSIGPSQSASQVNLVLAPPIPPPPVANGHGGQSTETPPANGGSTDGYHTTGGSSTSQTSPAAEMRRASYFQDTTHTFHVPPAHAISDLAMPVGTPATPQRHVLSRRITEEELPKLPNDDQGERRSWVNQLDIGPPSQSGHGQLSPTEGESTSEDETAELQEGKLAVVENPRFASGGGGGAGGAASAPNLVATTKTPATPQGSPAKSTSSPVKGFFGSLRGFFGAKTTRDRERKKADSDDEDVRAHEGEEAKRPGGALFARTKQRLHADRDGSPQKAGGKWETRTERNLRQLAKQGSDERLVEQTKMDAAAGRGGRDPQFSPVVMAEDAAVGEGPVKYKGRAGGRARVASDAVSGASTAGAAAGRRLRKPRGRSASVPPPAGAEVDSGREAVVKPGEGGEVKRRESNAGAGIRRAQEWVQREHAAAAAASSGDQPAPAPTTHQKGYSSDTGAITGSSTTVVVRKKSGTKGNLKPSAPSATATNGVSQGGKGTTTLSRNSSIISASSAPATMAKARGPSTTGTVADLGRYTQTGLGQGMPTTAVGRRPSLNSSATPSHRRSSSFDSHGPKGKATTHPQQANTNLMSIVEDVTRGNRQGWAAATKSSTMEVVKAPPRVGRQDVLDAARPRGPVMEIPKAPGPVVDLLRYGGGGSSDVDVSLQKRRHSVGGHVREGSASAPDLTQAGVVRAASTSRPAKSPLRSALRNTSRSPSPVLVPVPLAPRSVVQASAAPAAVSTPSTALPPPVGSALPWEKEVANEKGKGKAVGADQDSDDTASISSYETGHEMLESDEEDTEREEPRASPDRDKTPMPVTSAPAFRDSDVSSSTASVTPTQPLPRPVPANNALLADPRMGSDVSGSSDNTPTPQRRKSVRVSLQPTFSPTPPAIDDDDEEEQMKHAPWAWKGESTPAAPEARTPQQKKPNGSAERDMWEDSSEEDVEYQKARRLLSRAAKKKEKAA